jgi:hypothetical protein
LIALALPNEPFFLCALLACSAMPGVAESMVLVRSEFQTMALVST